MFDEFDVFENVDDVVDDDVYYYCDDVVHVYT